MQLEALAARETLKTPSLQAPVVSNDGGQDAAHLDAMNKAAILMDALQPQLPVKANTFVPPLIAAPASPVPVENATAVIPAQLVNTGLDVEMGADDIASAYGLQAPAVNDELHEQAPDETAQPTEMHMQPVEAAGEAVMDEQLERAPEAGAMDFQTVAPESTTTNRRLDAMDERINQIFCVLQLILLQKSSESPPLPDEPPVPPMQVQPMHALLPHLMLLPLAIETTAAQVAQEPATLTPAEANAKRVRSPFAVMSGGKAPQALEAIRAYQSAHRDPTFSKTDSDEDEREDRRENGHLLLVESGHPQEDSVPNQQSGVNKQNCRLFADDTDNDGNASTADSAIKAPANVRVSSLDSDQEKEVPAVVKPKNKKTAVKQSKSMRIVCYCLESNI